MPQYNGVWTLEAQAQAQSNQQWVTDPNFKNTTLLLQADGTGSGSQNNTFLDSSTNNVFINRLGNPTQGSFSPFSQAPGYWGNYFGSSTSDRLTFTSNASYAVGTGNFTAECFVNFSSNTKTNQWMFNYGASGQSTLFITLQSNVLSIPVGNSTVITYSFTPVVGTWYHIAVVRSGTGTNQVALYINGVSVATGTSSASLGQYALGVGGIDWAADYNVNGYLSNVRYSNVARYTSNFTPSTTPFVSDANTLLLTSQNYRFVDNSSLANTFTLGGTPSVQAFGPFAPALQWTPNVVGGSGYFDGTTDYLTGTITAVNNTTMTMECWVYNTALDNTNGNHYIMVNNSTNANYALTHDGTGKARYVSRNNSGGAIFDLISATNVLKLNQWQHVVGVRNASAASLYVDGVRVATVASPTVSTTDGTTLYISSNGGTGRIISGYLASTRIVSGTAIYNPTLTTCSVPTAPLTAVTNTRLLLNFNNAGIYDGKMNTSWETVNSTQVSTSVVKAGSGSIYFNGVASQRLLPSQLYPQLTFGTSDFTIECWIYVVGKNATTVGGIIDYRPGVNGTYVNWVVDFGGYGIGSTTAPRLVLYADSAVFMSSSSVLAMGQWNHIALCRANGISRMFINGVIDSGPTADTKNYASGGSAANYRPCIGATDGGDSLFGYIDDFRISRFARYIANFTPPQQALPRQ